MRRRELLGLALSAIGGSTMGCGGGGKKEPAYSGRIYFRFDWSDSPEWDKARSISVKISPLGFSGLYEDPVVQSREAAGSSLIGPFFALNARRIPVIATLHMSEEGTDNPIAASHFLVSTHFAADGATMYVPITIGSRARKLAAELDRDNQEKLQNTAAAEGWLPVQGKAHAFVTDTQNRILLMSTEEITWSSQDTTIATVTDRGMVSLIGFGATTLVARHASSGLTASVPVKLTRIQSQPPLPLPPGPTVPL